MTETDNFKCVVRSAANASESEADPDTLNYLQLLNKPDGL